jgi:DNA-binding transcriptional LysR family regulator
VIVNPTHWHAWHGRLRDMLDAIDAGFTEAEQDGLPPVGLCVSLLRIGVTDATRTSLLAPTLSPLIQKRPGLRVCLRVGRSDKLARAVHDGELDVALVPTYGDTSFTCEHTVIGFDPLLPVVRKAHPLARSVKVSLRDLQAYAWILSGINGPPYRLLVALHKKHGLTAPTVMVETDYSSEAAVALLRHTDLLALLPQSTLRLPEQSDLHVLPIVALKIPREVLLLTRTGSTSPLMHAFVEQVRKYARVIA